MPYEYHSYRDNELKIIFHEDRLERSTAFSVHWHKNAELLLVLEGTLVANIDGVESTFLPGEMAVIGSNQMHVLHTKDPACRYYCLIIDYFLCTGIERLPSRCTEERLVQDYLDIVAELGEQRANYREVVSGLCKTLLARLSRGAPTGETPPLARKVQLVRRAVQYIYEHFSSPFSLEAMCEALNVSKYHLAHTFKEITGETVLTHWNYVRCTNAQSLLVSGECNVAEAAFQSGFNTLSCFSKVYKQVLGHRPSDDLPDHNAQYLCT